MKKIYLILLIAILLSLSACRKDNATETPEPVEDVVAEDPKVEPEVIEEVATEEESEEVNKEPEIEKQNTTYARIYLDFIKKIHSSNQADKFALAYIDEDEIPELITTYYEEGNPDDSAFIYSIHNNSLIMITSSLVSMFRSHLDFSETHNLIYTGAGDVTLSSSIDRINQGQTEKILEAEWDSFYDNSIGDTLNHYSINGNEVSEDEYYKEFMKYLNVPYTRIGYDGLQAITFEYKDSSINETLADIKPYLTYNSVIDELNKLVSDNDTTNESEPWKAAYKDYLYDVMAGIKSLPNIIEENYYSPDNPVDFALQDITGNGIPELLISGWDTYWYVYTIDSDNNLEWLTDISFYNPETKEVFINDSATFEHYSVCKIIDGKIEPEYELGEGDVEGQISPYYRSDGRYDYNTHTYENNYNISEEEMNMFRNDFESGFKKYKPNGVKLISENIDAELNSP